MIQEVLPIVETKPIQFTIFGHAQPAGSKKAFYVQKLKRAIVTDDNKKSKPWQAEVKSAAREAYSGPLLDGPLNVRFVIYRLRPAGHFGTKGLNKKGSSAPFPTTKPDVLKLARGIEDALTGQVWRDDAQIVTEVLEKRWGEPERVEVEIREVSMLRHRPLAREVDLPAPDGGGWCEGPPQSAGEWIVDYRIARAAVLGRDCLLPVRHRPLVAVASDPDAELAVMIERAEDAIAAGRLAGSLR